MHSLNISFNHTLLLFHFAYVLRGSSLKESEIVEVQEGKTNYSVKILLLGKYLFCCGESYCLFV